MHTALLLEMAAEADSERTILGALAEGVSFAELAARARAGGHWLEQKGGDTIVFIGLNGHGLPTAIFAAGVIGKPFAPLNYRLSDEDLRKLLARTAPSVAIVDEDMMPRVAGTPGVTLVTRGDFEAACIDPVNRAAEPTCLDPDIAVLLFTSGTTGEPKAAVLRHSN